MRSCARCLTSSLSWLRASKILSAKTFHILSAHFSQLVWRIMGEVTAAIVVAAILQRGAAINSAGGYLRNLTERARAGQFSPGPMLMALIGNRKREKRRA